MGLLFKKKAKKTKDEVYELKLTPNDQEVEYGNVIGFFKFRDTLYYRAKGVSGRALDDINMSFTDSIKATYPEEFSNVLAKDISKILVQPLNV